MKTTLKKFTLFFLTVTTLILTLSINISSTFEKAQNFEEFNSTTNPSDPLEYTYCRASQTSLSFNDKKSTGIEYTSDINNIVTTLRQAMVQRNQCITVYYQVPLSDYDESLSGLQTIGDGIMNSALVHTKEPTEGDYLRWDMGGYGLSASISSDDAFYYFDLTYSITYYSTSEQQQELNTAVDALIEQFAFSSETSDYDKVCTIYDYICDNIVYDHENLNNSDHVLKYTAYAALINKTAVCQGYATLLYRLLLECDVNCRVITGTSSSEAHAWNIVELEGLFYNLDATWDAGQSPYNYFLKSEANFYDHTRNAEYLTEDFSVTYSMSEKDYSISSDIATNTWIDFASSSFSSGNGTQATPYVINTAEELALLAKLVNIEDKHYRSACYILGCDIDLAGYNWMPIGVIEGNGLGGSIDYRGFFGEFDGNGHTIRNMQIKEAYPSIYQYGLFGMIMGTVKDVTLLDAVIAFECTDAGWESTNGLASWIDAGGICGYSTDNGCIKNCRVTDISIEIKAAMNLTCGGAIGNLNYATAENIIVSGTVSGISGKAIQIGGCIGSLGNECTVETSGFTGNVSATSDGTIGGNLSGQGYSYLHYVGGFCGSAGRANTNVTMKNCYAFANVFSKYEQGTQSVGGFAGAIGLIRGKAIYENLIFNGEIVVERNGVSAVETNFWEGERGFSTQEDSSEWSYKNCVVISQSTVTVVDMNRTYNQTNVYALAEYTLSGLFVETLGFDESLWYVDFHHRYTLRNTHLNNTTSHTEVIDAAIPATCTNTGLTQGKHCSICNEILISQQIVVAIGHDWGAWYTTKAPTCTDMGTDEHECAVCHNKETRTTNATGHISAEAVDENRVEPTCTAIGHYESVIYCPICSAELSRERIIINKLGHDYSTEWTVDIEPTCTASGSKSHHCSRCNDRADITKIRETGHSFGDWKQHNAEQHKRICACGEIEYEDHIYSHEQDVSCNECGENRILSAQAPVTSTENPSGSENEKSGCGAVISGGLPLMLLLAGAAVGLTRKRKK